jgi:hypothetical protein
LRARPEREPGDETLTVLRFLDANRRVARRSKDLCRFMLVGNSSKTQRPLGVDSLQGMSDIEL